MSRRVIFQSFIEEHRPRSIDEDEASSVRSLVHVDEEKHNDDHVDEEKQEDGPFDPLEVMRRSVKKEQTIEHRRERRRRKAYGSVWWRYAGIRLQLRVLIISPRKVVLLFLGAFALIGLWAFLVFGRPESSSVWSDIDSRWGGLLTDNTSLVCEAPNIKAFTRQPANGLASVSYMLSGWFMLYMWVLDERYSASFEARFGNLPASLVLRRCFWSALLGLSMFHLGIVTWLRHATYSNVGKRLETTGYWTVLFAFSVCSVVRLLDPPRKLRTREWRAMSKITSFLFIFATMAVDVAFGIRIEALRQPGVPEIVFGTLAGLGLAAALIHWRMHRVTIESEVWLLFIGILFFVMGFLLAHFETRVCLGETAFLQPYAGWHFCNALASFFFYLYLRSDLWVRGDGAELAPRLTPFKWLFALVWGIWDHSREVLKGAQPTGRREKQEARITLLRTEALKPPQGEDDAAPDPTLALPDGQSAPTQNKAMRTATTSTSALRRIATSRSVKSFATMWTPELGFTSKQIRVAEFICGVVITGFVIFVIYLALARPSSLTG